MTAKNQTNTILLKEQFISDPLTGLKVQVAKANGFETVTKLRLISETMPCGNWEILINEMGEITTTTSTGGGGCQSAWHRRATD